MIGIGAGVEGSPTLSELSSETNLVLVYRIGASGSDGDDGRTDLSYVEIEGEVGIGVEFMGLRPSVGARVSGISGEISNQNDPEFEGLVNAGGFVDLRYRMPNAPLFASVRGSFGDLTGVDVMFGVVF
jgi:hypothetical protein